MVAVISYKEGEKERAKKGETYMKIEGEREINEEKRGGERRGETEDRKV